MRFTLTERCLYIVRSIGSRLYAFESGSGLAFACDIEP
jgi:hypothetical protein